MSIDGLMDLGLTAALEFAGTLINPLGLLALLAVSICVRANPRLLRGSGPVIGAALAAPGALTEPALAQAAAALVGGAVAGLALAEIVLALVLPFFRLLAWFAGTAMDLLTFGVRRVFARAPDTPADESKPAGKSR